MTGIAGLACAIGTVALAYVGAMRVAARLVGDRPDAEEMQAAFVHSLVPIALARRSSCGGAVTMTGHVSDHFNRLDLI